MRTAIVDATVLVSNEGSASASSPGRDDASVLGLRADEAILGKDRGRLEVNGRRKESGRRGGQCWNPGSAAEVGAGGDTETLRRASSTPGGSKGVVAGASGPRKAHHGYYLFPG